MSRVTKIGGGALLSLVLLSLVAFAVGASEKPPTELYVKTKPSGATVLVDGKELGTSPELFEVEPGAHTVTVKLAGHQPIVQKVRIREGRIKRVIFELQKRPGAGDAVTAVARTTVAGSILKRLESPPEGWKVLTSSVVSPGETAVMGRRLGGRIKKLSNTILSGHGERVQVNVFECRTEADAEKIHQAVLAAKGDPAYALRFDNTIVEFVGTFDVAFAKRAARELFMLQEVRKPEAASFWTCSMHPQIKVPKAGKCPICAMDLILLEGESRGDLVRMVGKVDYDQSKLANVTVATAGRVERLYVDFKGVQIRKGDCLVDLHSPKFIVAQHELLQARKAYNKALAEEGKQPAVANLKAILKATEEKLRLLGMLDEQIQELNRRGSPSDHLTIHAPKGGIIIHKNVEEGAYIQQGTKIYTIADLSQVWVYLDAYEGDIRWLHSGQQVELTAEAYPGETFKGRIAMIDPVVNEKTRTVRVRVDLPNEDMKLKPGMLVRAIVRSRVAAGEQVPDGSPADKAWTCSMHPKIKLPKPGKCPICAMDLIARPPRSAAEQAVREVISNFVEAVTREDKASVTKFISKRSHHILEQIRDMREIMSRGMKAAEISLVVVAHGRALAVTDFAQVQDPQYKAVMCVVYTVVKQGDRWVIEDIDVEDVKGLSDEIRRLQAEPDQDESTQPSKKVHLPDADTRGAATVLDLASGEVFPFPGIDGPPDLMVFTRLGKGDLFFDRVLGCPRGAKAMQWDGKRFVTFPPKEQIEDASAYELPVLPCRLLITTAENKHFDVTILALTEDGGIDLEYVPADPAVVPDTTAEGSAGEAQPRLSPRKLFSASHGAAAGILAVAFSPDGLTVAAVDEMGMITLCDARSGGQRWGRGVLTPEEEKLLLYEDRQGRIHTASIAYSHDGYTLAVAADPVVRLYDAQSGRLERTLEDKQLSGQLKELKRPPATVSRELELLAAVPHAHGRVYCVAFSGDAALLATSGSHLIRADGSSVINAENATSGKLKLWDAKTGELKRDLGEHYSFVRSVAFSHDGKILASIGAHPPSWSRSVRLWDPQTGAVKSVLPIARGGGPDGPVAFSPDGKLVAAGALVSELDPGDGIDRLGRGSCRLLVWNAHTGALLLNHRTPGLVTSLSFSADGKTLAAAVDNRGVTLWDSETLTQKGLIQLSTEPPRDVQVAFSPTGNRLAVGAKNEKHGLLTVWEVGQR